MHSVTSGAVYNALSETKTFTVSLVGGVFTRAPSYGIGCKPQISGTRYYLRRMDNDNNWLPSYWGTGTNTLIQGSVVVRIN